MKYLFFILVIALCSCKSLQVSADKNTKNTSGIGVEWNSSGAVNELLQPKIDQAIMEAMDKFNGEKHSFEVHKKTPKEKDCITIDFTRGKIVSKGGKAAGYIVTGLGLIVTPIALLSADVGFVAAFYYLPSHRLEGKMDLSSTLAADRRSKKRIYIETGALFARTDTQVNKLVAKFSEQFYNALVKIESQLKSK